jgi:hypothetical protein
MIERHLRRPSCLGIEDIEVGRHIQSIQRIHLHLLHSLRLAASYPAFPLVEIRHPACVRSQRSNVMFYHPLRGNNARIEPSRERK